MLRQLTQIKLVIVFAFVLQQDTSAQLINTTTPFQNLNSSFYESNSIGWSLRGDGWFANFGGGAPIPAPFGAPGNGGGLSGGFGFGGGGLSGGLGFNFAQGSSRSISSSAASVTTMNGMPGSIQSGTIRPFVTGVTPIVGGYPTIPDTGQVAANIGANQLSALRRSQAARQSKKLDDYLRRAELGEKEGNKRMARANYRSAMALAPEPLRSQIAMHMRKMLSSR